MYSLVNEFSMGVIAWYDFKTNSKILYLYTDEADPSIPKYMERKGSVRACNIADRNLQKRPRWRLCGSPRSGETWNNRSRIHRENGISRIQDTNTCTII